MAYLINGDLPEAVGSFRFTTVLTIVVQIGWRCHPVYSPQDCHSKVKHLTNIQDVSKPMSQTFPGYSPPPLKQKFLSTWVQK
jgi:hypothetical protein